MPIIFAAVLHSIDLNSKEAKKYLDLLILMHALSSVEGEKSKSSEYCKYLLDLLTSEK